VLWHFATGHWRLLLDLTKNVMVLGLEGTLDSKGNHWNPTVCTSLSEENKR